MRVWLRRCVLVPDDLRRGVPSPHRGARVRVTPGSTAELAAHNVAARPRSTEWVVGPGDEFGGAPGGAAGRLRLTQGAGLLVGLRPRHQSGDVVGP